MEKIFLNENVVTLPNGIKLICIKRDTQICSVHAGIKIGSLHEKKKEKGISHFIEHMLFKGTKNRDNEKLNNDLENRGGEYNAYTDYNSTVVTITALGEELSTSLEIIGDMLQNSVFPEDEMEKERGVILAEIRTSKDDVEELSFRRTNEIAFNKSPIKYDTIGDENTVKKFTREQLIEFYEKQYIPNNCFISIVSPFEHGEVIDLVEKNFGAWQKKELDIPTIAVENNIPVKKITYKKDIEQSTIIYAFTFHNLEKEGELALKILNHKLAESANSILFRELREERGLAYDVYSNLDLTNYVKILYIYTAVSSDKVDETIKVIEECIDKIKKEEINFDDDTINLMKKVLRTAVASTLEDSTDLGNYVLHQSIDGENIDGFLEDMKNLESIKREDIYNIARQVLKDPTIHILLPEK